MSKNVLCYTYDVKKEKQIIDGIYFKEIIKQLFDVNDKKIEDIKRLNNGNIIRIFKNDGREKDRYISLELIKSVEMTDKDEITSKKTVPEGLLFFRIGKEKDIEGVMKRNNTTLEGKEIIDKSEQGSYNLEVCTYILVDYENKNILEIKGQFAPTITNFIAVLNQSINKSENKKLDKVSLTSKGIMTDQMIELLRNKGVRLGKVLFSCENPDLQFLSSLGFSAKEINKLKNMGVYELNLTLKGKGKSPLSSINADIHDLITIIKDKSSSIVRKGISFIGSTKSTSSKEYSFGDSDVKFSLEIPYTKTTYNGPVKLTLDEIAYQVYNRLIQLYNDNKDNIEKYK